MMKKDTNTDPTLDSLQIFSLHSPGGYHYQSGEHPELAYGRGWLTLDGAKAAAVLVLSRLGDKLARDIAEWNAEAAPDEAKRAYESPAKQACQTEVRLVSRKIAWKQSPTERNESAMLEMRTECRHRWREARMIVHVNVDGTATQTYDLGPFSEWGPWGRRIYVPGPEHPPGDEHYVIEVRCFDYTIEREPPPRRPVKGRR